MAKTDSFFIRASLNAEQSGFKTTTIDLGAFVDALGKSVLRIHNVAVSITDNSGGFANLGTSANSTGAAQFQVTTQSQSGMVLPGLDKSLIFSGMSNSLRVPTASGVASQTSDEYDNLPQHWRNGVLVAVEQLYLNGQVAGDWQEDVYINLIMECTVETLSEKAAMALALSQS